MKKLFTIVFIIIANYAISQTVYSDYWDGVVYFKIKNSVNTEIPIYESNITNISTFDKFPEFKNLIETYSITKLYKPFKTQTPKIQRIYKIKFNDIEKIDLLIETLEKNEKIEYVEKNPIYKLFALPDDIANEQWYFDYIKAEEAWSIATGNSDIKIAIVDDANRYTHEDLADNVWHNPNEIADNQIDDDNNGYIDDVNGWDAADNDNDPAPPENLGLFGEMGFTHGTHCSGIAAGVTNNGIGIASISYNVSYIPVKCVEDGSFFPLGIQAAAEGFDYAIAAGADVISMSFGGPQAETFTTLETLIATAHDMGIVIVAAAGNDGDETINYPANFDNVIAVGATSENDSVASFSQRGDFIDVMAPGGQIYSTLAHSTPYDYQDGTSMACPLVAGICALMLSYDNSFTPEQITECLKNSCDNIDNLNPNLIGKIGAGRVNAYAALQCMQSSIGFNETQKETDWAIYPNPANTIITFKSLMPAKNISICNILGKKIFEQNLDNQYQQTINTQEFPEGIYIVNVLLDNYTIKSKKILISH